MLLYLVKHSVIDGANRAAFSKMHLEVKYVLDTKNLGLNIKTKGIIINRWT